MMADVRKVAVCLSLVSTITDEFPSLSKDPGTDGKVWVEVAAVWHVPAYLALGRTSVRARSLLHQVL